MRVQLVLPAGTDTEIWDVAGIGGAKSLDLELERNSPRLGLPLRQCETQLGREQMFRKITVAFDESEEAARALQAAVELAKSLDASLNVISVIEPPPIYFSFSTLVAPYTRWTDEMQTRYTNLQSKARQLAENAGLAIDATISNGDEIGSILAAAIHNECDLLVIGMPKHTWMIGHTAHNLAEGVPCALLGIR